MAYAVWCDEHGESHGAETKHCPECGVPDWVRPEPHFVHHGYWDAEIERQFLHEVKGG